MINNDVLDMTHFTDANAGEAEKEVASAFAVRKEEVKNYSSKIIQAIPMQQHIKISRKKYRRTSPIWYRMC